MDATRTDIEYLYRMLEACINAGATTVNIPIPSGMPSDRVRRAHPPHQGERPNIDKAIISVHCHNDSATPRRTASLPS